MESKPTLVWTIRRPLIAAGAWSALLALASYVLPDRLLYTFDDGLAANLYEIPRIIFAVWAGWLAIARLHRGLWAAGLAAILVFLVDHVFVHGGIYLLLSLFGSEFPYLQAFAGVVVSFLMFAPLAFVLGIVGGVIARRHATSKPHGA